MKKNKIMSIGLFAILSLSFIPMLFQNNAYAQSPYTLSKITGFNEDIIGADFDSTRDVLWVLTSEDDGSFRIGRAYSINGTTNQVITSAVVYNQTNTNHVIYDMDCNYPYCYVTAGDGLSTLGNGTVSRFDITSNTASFNINTDFIQDGGSFDNSYIISASTSFNSTTLWWNRVRGTSATSIVSISSFDGKTVDMDAFTPVFHSIASGLSSTGRNVQAMAWSQLPDPNYDLIFRDTTNTGTTDIYYYNANLDTVVCDANTVANSAVQSGLVIDHLNYGKFYMGGTSGQILEFDNDTCNLLRTIPNTDTGLANTIYDMFIIEIGGTKYMMSRDTGTGGSISFMPWNGTHFTESEFIVNSAPSSSQGNAGTGIVAHKHPSIGRITSGLSDVGFIYVPMTNTDRAVLVIDVGLAEDDDVLGIDCTLPANAGILICRLTETTGGNIGGLGGIIDTGLFTLFTNSGIIDGTDTDPQTNGIGYFITITGFGVMTAMFFIATKGRLNEVPTFIWMLSAIALLGAITAIGWLDPTFLIIGIISIIALASMQIRNTLSSGLDFSRGDF